MVTETRTSEIAKLNAELKRISSSLYPEGGLELRIMDPSEIKEVDKNARYFQHEKFSRLVENIAQDGRLESVPLCIENEKGECEVISGNHRTKAAIKAKIPEILSLVITQKISNSQKRAKQISHNELVGQDDMAILRELWEEITDLSDKMYTGFDSIKIGELEKINFSALSTPNIRTETITLWFLPEEVKEIEALIETAQKMVASKEIFIAPLRIYDDVFDMLIEIKKKHDIKNTAVAMMYIFEIAKAAMAAMNEQEMNESNQ